MKTRKTLSKRVKITKNGIILKKQNRTGHLKRKWSANKKTRKRGLGAVVSKGYIKNIKQMLGKSGSKITLNVVESENVEAAATETKSNSKATTSKKVSKKKVAPIEKE